MSREPRSESPSMWEALRRLADASQRLVVDRLELVRIETREDATTLAKALILVLATLPLLLMGWVALMAGVVLALSPVLPLAATLCIVGGAHVVIGGLGAYMGVSRMSAGATPEPAAEAVASMENGRAPRAIGESVEERVADRRA